MNTVLEQQDLKLDIQTKGVEMNTYLDRKIQNMIKKLKQLLPDVAWMDIYLRTNSESVNPRTVVLRMGIPGTDIVASDSGDRWKIILKNIEKRVIRQLEKRKMLLAKAVAA
ncbi:MAG: hypothetical protein EOO14_02810 [Chitinophagaceae bacterium]|nr:MAG: hypothetical protein EOO14_02810 [Chitinophagaceae bacterium]